MGTCKRVCKVCFKSLMVLHDFNVKGRLPFPSSSTRRGVCAWAWGYGGGGVCGEGGGGESGGAGPGTEVVRAERRGCTSCVCVCVCRYVCV
jgi:hypothetical protein